MRGFTPVPFLVLLSLGLSRPAGADAAPGNGAAAGLAWPRTPFVIGAPGRLAAEGDRRHPRRYPHPGSAVGACADIEDVADRTWLRHELELYARRAVDCTGLAPAWCRREVRRLGSARVIFLASGMHAELVWMSGAGTAVRLGWQRIVDTRTGTMTLDDPPADFAAALLAEFPSGLAAFEFDAARDRAWAGDEADRLRYYLDLADHSRQPWCAAAAPSLSPSLSLSLLE